MKFLLSVILSFSFASIATASNGVFDRGNGGSGIFCGKKPPHLTVLDLYDLEKNGLHLSPYIPHNFNGALDFVMRRIQERSPKLGELLKDEYHTFQKEVHFVSEQLPVVNDQGHFSPVDDSCRVMQIAVQWTEDSSFGRLYFINSDLWSILDGPNQAALVIHELVYRISLTRSRVKEDNSVKVRALVGQLFSAELDSNKNWPLIIE